MGYVAYFLPQIIAQTLKSCRSNMFLLCQTSLGGKLDARRRRKTIILPNQKCCHKYKIFSSKGAINVKRLKTDKNSCKSFL